MSRYKTSVDGGLAPGGGQQSPPQLQPLLRLPSLYPQHDQAQQPLEGVLLSPFHRSAQQVLERLNISLQVTQSGSGRARTRVVFCVEEGFAFTPSAACNSAGSGPLTTEPGRGHLLGNHLLGRPAACL